MPWMQGCFQEYKKEKIEQNVLKYCMKVVYHINSTFEERNENVRV